MRVTMISRWDFAGLAYTLARALREAGHVASSWHLETWPWLGYPTDRQIDDASILELYEDIERADVVMLNELWPDEYGIDIAPTCIVHMHHHGSIYRKQRDRYRALDKRADIVTVSTPCLVSEDVPWLPSIVEEASGAPRLPYDETTRVAHMTTSKVKRSSSSIEQAMSTVTHQRDDITFDIITGISHVRALERLSIAQIAIDHMNPELSNGVGSIEAMSFGIPVLSASRYQNWYARRFGYTPIVHVDDADDLARCVLRMHDDYELRDDFAARSRRFYEDTHAPDVCVERVLTLWQRGWLERNDLKRGYVQCE